MKFQVVSCTLKEQKCALRNFKLNLKFKKRRVFSFLQVGSKKDSSNTMKFQNSIFITFANVKK